MIMQSYYCKLERDRLDNLWIMESRGHFTGRFPNLQQLRPLNADVSHESQPTSKQLPPWTDWSQSHNAAGDNATIGNPIHQCPVVGLHVHAAPLEKSLALQNLDWELPALDRSGSFSISCENFLTDDRGRSSVSGLCSFIVIAHRGDLGDAHSSHNEDRNPNGLRIVCLGYTRD